MLDITLEPGQGAIGQSETVAGVLAGSANPDIAMAGIVRRAGPSFLVTSVTHRQSVSAPQYGHGTCCHREESR
jgi:hypothetical protein